MNEPLSDRVDVAFALAGATFPRDHQRLLADALEAAVPWLATEPGVGVHRLKLVAGEGDTGLLSRRARLLVRVPRARVADLDILAGRELAVGEHRVLLGRPVVRELLPHRTLYAEFVAARSDDELAFLDAVSGELDALGVSCGRVCGRERSLVDGPQRVPGFSLMLDALSIDDSLRVLERGVGAHRRLGCGLFVPHRSAAAVGG